MMTSLREGGLYSTKWRADSAHGDANPGAYCGRLTPEAPKHQLHVTLRGAEDANWNKWTLIPTMAKELKAKQTSGKLGA
jgi:hypothetical protein